MTVNECTILKKIYNNLDDAVFEGWREAVREIKDPKIHEILENTFTIIRQKINKIHPYHGDNEYNIESIEDCSDYVDPDFEVEIKEYKPKE